MHKPAPTTEKQTRRKTRVRVPGKYTDAAPSVGVTPKVSLQKTTKIPAPTDTGGDKTMSSMVSCRKYVPMQPNPGYQKRAAKDSFLVAGGSLLYVNQLKHHGRSTDVRSLYKREGMEAGAAGPSDSEQSRGGVNRGKEPTGSDPRSEKSRLVMRDVPDTVPDNAIPEVQTPATDQDQHADYHSELQGNGEMEGKSGSVRKFFCW
ncbi:hypothetical protein Q9L58_006143 [Maublancomyces gigas]|uniref:Uncharacterized protein n=1 Tax=Discina gigas TaxID=1032678 RepID=A0ABR3GG65_9PEZI